MKVTTALAMMVSLVSHLPIADALVGSDWTMSNVPASGLRDITFPITMVEVDHISGYYFAQQYGFVGSGTGYTGLQPRPDKAGHAVIHAVFSSFIKGSTSTDSNCSDGADGGSGVSCSFEFNGVYSHTYNLEVKGNGQLWTGTAIDTATGARIHIGSYTLPQGAGGIRGSEGGFVEWFPWNGSEPPNHCAKLPYQKTIFGVPTTTNPGSVGTQCLAHEYGDCEQQVAFHTERVSGGGMVNNCGFKGATGHGTDVEDFNYQDAFVAMAQSPLI